MFGIMLLSMLGWLLPIAAIVALVKYIRTPSGQRNGGNLLERRVELLERELETTRREMHKLTEETEFYRRLYAGQTGPSAAGAETAPSPEPPPTAEPALRSGSVSATES